MIIIQLEGSRVGILLEEMDILVIIDIPVIATGISNLLDGFRYQDIIKANLGYGWSISDMSIGKTISVFVNNVFDEEYETYLMPFYDAAAKEAVTSEYPGAGRSIFFNVSFVY